MIHLKKDISLKPYNTFNIDVTAKYYIEFTRVEHIQNFVNSEYSNINPKLILGEGSNILFTQSFEGIIIHPLLKGIETLEENPEHILLRVGAGENWDDFVNYCVERNYGGIENLSHIPGSVGASPIQNIGAYGVEVKNVIEHVETIDLETGKNQIFNKSACGFKYRSSIFKTRLKNKHILTHITFKLDKHPSLITHYGNLNKLLEHYPQVTIQNIRKAVITIRSQKLPDPEKLGNAGSFFKNPVIDKKKADSILKQYPDMPCFKESNNMFKLSSAWLIEQCGWKGKRKDNTGCYINQPLVIVNFGKATGKEIINLAGEIQKTVKEKFGVTLETEVNIF